MPRRWHIRGGDDAPSARPYGAESKSSSRCKQEIWRALVAPGPDVTREIPHAGYFLCARAIAAQPPPAFLTVMSRIHACVPYCGGTHAVIDEVPGRVISFHSLLLGVDLAVPFTKHDSHTLVPSLRVKSTLRVGSIPAPHFPHSSSCASFIATSEGYNCFLVGEAVCDGHWKSICLRIFPATSRTSEIVRSKAGLREIPHRSILSSKSHRIVGNRFLSQSHPDRARRAAHRSILSRLS